MFSLIRVKALKDLSLWKGCSNSYDVMHESFVVKSVGVESTETSHKVDDRITDL